MANARAANTYYIDTQYATNEELTVTGSGLLVLGVYVTATAANAILDLTDGGTKKLNLRVATAGSTEWFPCSNEQLTGVRFSTSVRPTTLTNAIATVIIKDQQGG